MFKKKLLIACASLVMGGLTAFVAPAKAAENPLVPPAATTPAVPVVFNHVGEIEGVPVVFQFRFTDVGRIGGKLIIGQQTFTVTGIADEDCRTFRGKWTSGSNTYDFVAKVENGKLIFQTNGKTVALKPIIDRAAVAEQQNAPQQNVPPQDAPRPVISRPAAAEVNNLPAVQTVDGKFFSAPVPQGWKTLEREGDLVVISSDGKTTYGMRGRATQANTPAEFAEEYFRGYRVSDMKILNSREFAGGEGQKGLEAVVSFTGPDNVVRTGVIRVLLKVDGSGRNFGVILHAATPRDNETNLKAVATLAGQIKVIPQQQAAPVAPNQVGFAE